MTQYSIHPERSNTMYADQIQWPKLDTFSFSANVRPARAHYKFAMGLGRVFPTTRAQAKHFVVSGACLDVLNNVDVERVEELLNKYGIRGCYQYTKSRRWVRMTNDWQLRECLKKEYNL